MAQICLELGEGDEAEKILYETRAVLASKLPPPSQPDDDPAVAATKQKNQKKEGSRLSSRATSSSGSRKKKEKETVMMMNLEVLEGWVECSLFLARLLMERYIRVTDGGDGVEGSGADGKYDR